MPHQPTPQLIFNANTYPLLHESYSPPSFPNLYEFLNELVQRSVVPVLCCVQAMKVLTARDGVITNSEVLDLLKEQHAKRLQEEQAMPLPGARRGAPAASAWQLRQNAVLISEQVIKYLSDSDAVLQSRESIASFMTAMERFQLTRAELLSIVNTLPRSNVEVHMLVEECEERLSEQDINTILDLCSAHWLQDDAGGSAANGDEDHDRDGMHDDED